LRSWCTGEIELEVSATCVSAGYVGSRQGQDRDLAVGPWVHLHNGEYGAIAPTIASNVNRVERVSSWRQVQIQLVVGVGSKWNAVSSTIVAWFCAVRSCAQATWITESLAVVD
jgi:hypothetical protein